MNKYRFMTMKKKEYNTPDIQVLTISLLHLMAGSVQEGDNPLNSGTGDVIDNPSDIAAKPGGWNAWDED